MAQEDQPTGADHCDGAAPAVAVVGGGPAGMTAALLLAGAGHRVKLFDRADELGGLWASKLDAEGYSLGDNSCKVYQPSYQTTPALLRLIGTDWERHFVPRHDLTDDWLKPFISDCSWRDLAILAGACALRRTGLALGLGHRWEMELRGAGKPPRQMHPPLHLDDPKPLPPLRNPNPHRLGRPHHPPIRLRTHLPNPLRPPPTLRSHRPPSPPRPACHPKRHPPVHPARRRPRDPPRTRLHARPPSPPLAILSLTPALARPRPPSSRRGTALATCSLGIRSSPRRPPTKDRKMICSFNNL